MNDRYKSTSLASTVTAAAFALIFSTTFVLGAVAPGQVQAATSATPNAITSLAA